MPNTLKRLLVGLAALGLALAALPAAAAPQRVAILPFSANAKDDISYLIKGVRDMLATRLAWGDKVAVIEPDLVAPALKEIPGPYNDEKARQVGKKLSADAVVYGAITMMGQAVSVDARVIRSGEDRPALSAFVQAANLDQVIPQINEFAQRINAELFKRPGAAPAAATASAAQKGAAAAPAAQGGGTDRTDLIGAVKSPAAQWQQEKEAVEVDKLPPNISPLNPLFLRALSGVDSDRYWRSPRIEGTITALSVGDIDLDGKNELVVCLPDRIRVYRLDGQTFGLVTEFKNGPPGHYLFVDIADIDGDGRPEVFVSSIYNGLVNSFVLVWAPQGGGLAMKVKDLDYYLRVQPNPLGKGNILWGQAKSMDKPFAGPVYRMKASEGTYVPDTALSLPEHAHIYNFVQADINGSGEAFTVMIGPGHTLQVWRNPHDQQYKGGEIYGMSAKFIQTEGWTDPSNFGEEDVWNFIPTRLVLNDLDGDGRAEIVVVQNKDSMEGLFQKLRMMYRGTIFSFYWNGMSLVENWRTPRISGYLTDYTIADVGNVGRPALIMSVVQTDMQGFWEKGTGHIVAFTLKPQSEKTPAKKEEGL